MIALPTVLNDVDPFYRYEIDLRAGHLRNQPIEVAMQAETNAAFIEYRQATEDYFRVMQIIPRSPAALRLAPTTPPSSSPPPQSEARVAET